MSEHMARHMGIYPSIYFILSIGQVKPRSSAAVVPRPRRGRGGGAWASIHLSIHPWGSIHLSIHLSGTGSSRAAARRWCRRRAGGAAAAHGQVKPRSSAASVPPPRSRGAAAAHGAGHAEKTEAGRREGFSSRGVECLPRVTSSSAWVANETGAACLAGALASVTSIGKR